jgi:hypothetical protein
VHAVKALARAALAAIALPEGIPTAPCAIVAFPAGGTLDVLAPAQKPSNWWFNPTRATLSLPAAALRLISDALTIR